MLSSTTFHFLQELAENNSRDWFQENRRRYEVAKSDFENLVEKLIQEVQTFQDLGATKPKDCIFRINRDVRFSKDKSPYKKWFAAGIGPGGRHSGRVDYYLHVQPGNQTFLGAGMWSPTPEHLAKFRQEIDYNPQDLKKIIENPVFREFFPEIHGETMKTSPKGYDRSHPEIELLRRKQLFFSHTFTDKEVLSPQFVTAVSKGIQLLKPYTDFLNYIFHDEADRLD
ncbi:DUF2461 domain-containing protein [Arundinibacter roseus]|uniref:DUF2461 domain-containing protein n=1 Tax=Arundinibacter roseus TaxID=2070510 RepID=A0A4R4KKB1_9BACT|nr:DUF2461 domain-containing protein [Arundinibacter roseus]TDB67031.1 DUF2461 domain-containing protein [Arundinibacter roseus]